MRIEVLHSITHDTMEYPRGVYDLPPELAEHFLAMRDSAYSVDPLALLPGTTQPIAVAVDVKDRRPAREPVRLGGGSHPVGG